MLYICGNLFYTYHIRQLGRIFKGLQMKQIRLGDFKSSGERYMQFPNQKTVWVLNHYDRSSQKYSLSPVDDMNREIFRGANTFVVIGFDY